MKKITAFLALLAALVALPASGGWDGAGNVNRTNGVFTGANVWQDSRDAGRKIRADDMDTHDQDIADAIEKAVNRDGENSPTVNLPMGGFRHSGVGNATARDQYSSVDSLQDGDHVYAQGTGTTNTYVIALSPAITAYVSGMVVRFKVNTGPNTGPSTLNINTIGAKSILRHDGQELLAGDMLANGVYVVIYETIADAFFLITPPKSILPRGWIDGLTLSNNGSQPLDDIDIAAGVARDDLNGVDLELGSTLVKQIDAAWAVGTNAGCLDGTESVGGTPDANTDIALWEIMRSDTGVVDVLCSESFSSPTFPTNYDKKRLIGGTRTDGSANIIADHFMQVVPGGRTFQSGIQAITSAALVTLTHLLGAEPRNIEFILENTTTEFNYAVGERIAVTPYNSSGGATTRFNSITITSSSISIRLTDEAVVFKYANQSTGAQVSLTNGSWDLYVRAEL